MLLRLLSAFLKLPRGYPFMVSGVGNNDFSHTECQACSLESSRIFSQRRFPNRVHFSVGKVAPGGCKDGRVRVAACSPRELTVILRLQWTSWAC